MKRFTKNIENFTCDNCGSNVVGNGYTNHCPECLCSKHVDHNPGDRSCECKGLMRPVAVESKKGLYVLVHKCSKCGFIRRNKCSNQDNFKLILLVSSSAASV